MFYCVNTKCSQCAYSIINFLQNIESAIQDCTRAIELDPDYLKAYLRRSKLYERTDKLDEALEDIKKVLEIDRNYAEAAYNARVIYKCIIFFMIKFILIIFFVILGATRKNK